MPARQILWTFSIYLEAVAILPQLVLLQRTQNIDNLTGNYVFLLGCARKPRALGTKPQTPEHGKAYGKPRVLVGVRPKLWGFRPKTLKA